MVGLRTIVAVGAIFASTTAFAAPAGLGPKCMKIYNTYAGKSAPKAFAVSDNGYCGWASRKKSTDAELELAKKKAIGFCMQAAGTDCRVVESVR